MLHVAQPENVEPWFAAATAAGVRDFDYIGVSYYPKWSTFNMKQAGAALATIKKRFKADIIVVEVSYPWTLRDAGDKASNLLGEDSLLRGYPATPAGQQRFMNDVVRNDPARPAEWASSIGNPPGFPRVAPRAGERDRTGKTRRCSISARETS